MNTQQLTDSAVPSTFNRWYKRCTVLYGTALFIVGAVTILLNNFGPQSYGSDYYVVLSADLISVPVTLAIAGLAINIAYSEFYARRWIAGGARFWFSRLTATAFMVVGFLGIYYAATQVLHRPMEVSPSIVGEAIVLLPLISSWIIAEGRRASTW